MSEPSFQPGGSFQQQVIAWLGHISAQQIAIQNQVNSIQQGVSKIMSSDASDAAALTDIDNKVTITLTAARSMQAAIVALTAQLAAANVGLSPATQALLSKAQTDADAMETEVGADAATDTPPAPAPAA